MDPAWGAVGAGLVPARDSISCGSHPNALNIGPTQGRPLHLFASQALAPVLALALRPLVSKRAVWVYRNVAQGAILTGTYFLFHSWINPYLRTIPPGRIALTAAAIAAAAWPNRQRILTMEEQLAAWAWKAMLFRLMMRIRKDVSAGILKRRDAEELLRLLRTGRQKVKGLLDLFAVQMFSEGITHILTGLLPSVVILYRALKSGNWLFIAYACGIMSIRPIWTGIRAKHHPALKNILVSQVLKSIIPYVGGLAALLGLVEEVPKLAEYILSAIVRHLVRSIKVFGERNLRLERWLMNLANLLIVNAAPVLSYVGLLLVSGFIVKWILPDSPFGGWLTRSGIVLYAGVVIGQLMTGRRARIDKESCARLERPRSSRVLKRAA